MELMIICMVGKHHQTATRGKKVDHKYGERKHRSGDIVEMILDLGKWKLSYTLNSKDQGICYDHIEKSKYKGMVCIWRHKDSVKLLLYSCKH